jgi:plasmid stabilization system protein ParE
MSKARLSPKAEQDLDGICDYIAADNPTAADRVRQIILDTADFLAEHPEVGRQIQKAAIHHAETRWFVVPRLRNYLIFYRPFRKSIAVIRLLYAAQDWTRFFR